ncbi:MAG: VanW family protein [Ancrocorticia sp.]|uniref:VanW family protein n=2 Tax=Ancrocorticia sp. TaxID=2593684 RepID=UPI003F8F1939
MTEDDSRDKANQTLGAAVFNRRGDNGTEDDKTVADGQSSQQSVEESTTSVTGPAAEDTSPGNTPTEALSVPETDQPTPAEITHPEEGSAKDGAPATAATPAQPEGSEDQGGGWEEFASSSSAPSTTEETANIPVIPPAEAGQEAADEPPTDEGGSATKKRRKRWPWITAAAVLLVGAAYVGGAFYFADRVPKGTEIAGVQMGGLDRDAAAAKLKADVVDQVNQPVDVVVAGDGEGSGPTPVPEEEPTGSPESDTTDTPEGEATDAAAPGSARSPSIVLAADSDEAEAAAIAITPADYSLSVDENATIDSVVGFSLSPARMWAHVAGGTNVEPVYTYDEDQLADTVDSIAQQSNREPSNALLAFDGTEPVVTEAQIGLTLDKEAASDALTHDVLTAPTPITLTAEEAEPTITTEAANEALENIAKPLVDGNLTVAVNDDSTELTPEQLAAAASFEVNEDEGTLDLSIDGEELADVVSEALPDVLTPGKDARIEIENHSTPKIIESEDGYGIGADELAAEVKDSTQSDDRTVTVEPTKVPADFTTEDAKELGVKEVISEIKTPLTDDSVRTTNLQVGTAKITNTLVKPGDTFSLEAGLGPITADNGFVSSGVVANGFNSEAMGGGLSQLSTNTFNIGYLGGMKDVEHKPHSKYFDRYPMGREATLWEGTIDMKWENNTPYGVVIDTWVADGYVHSQLWSTKYWDVSTSTSDPYSYVQPTTKTNPAHDCVPSGAGGPGFTVTVSREVSHDGTVNEEDSGSYNWTYSPVDAVKCD